MDSSTHSAYSRSLVSSAVLVRPCHLAFSVIAARCSTMGLLSSYGYASIMCVHPDQWLALIHWMPQAT